MVLFTDDSVGRVLGGAARGPTKKNTSVPSNSRISSLILDSHVSKLHRRPQEPCAGASVDAQDRKRANKRYKKVNQRETEKVKETLKSKKTKQRIKVQGKEQTRKKMKRVKKCVFAPGQSKTYISRNDLKT